MRGESVDIPRYDFITGRRTWHNNPLTLDERSILIVEGIHGLNPRLTPSVPEAQKFRIYISCFTSVAMDNLSRIATTDNRLLRRLTRDYTQRGADAVATLSRWGSVRRGEEKHIFPYQENADVMLNSSLFYEISVLRPYAEKILREVPDTVPEYDEARRMLKFLKNFTPIPPDEIPPTSIIREFIGGSSFSTDPGKPRRAPAPYPADAGTPPGRMRRRRLHAAENISPAGACGLRKNSIFAWELRAARRIRRQ